MFEAGAAGSGGETPVTHTCAQARARPAPSVAAVDELEAEVAEVCGVLNAGHAALVGLIAKMLTMECAFTSGTLTAEQWVAWKCGLSAAHARSLVAMARRLGELPVTGAAFEAGELSADQVGVIARHAPTHIDDQAAELAKLTGVAQLLHSLSRYSYQAKAEPEPDEPPAEPADLTKVSFGHDEDGWWRLSATFGPDQGALVETALGAARRALDNDDVDDETKVVGGESPESRPTWADSLLAMADRSLGNTAVNRRNDDRTTVTVHVRADEDSGISAHLHLGPVLPDALRLYACCDARIKPIFTVGGTPVSVGRSQRIVPERTRAVVEDRDGGCRVPGCERSKWLHIHHIVAWEDQGPTDTPNLIALCQPHHRKHHQAKLGITGNGDDPHGVIFSDHRGRVLDACGRPTLPPRDLPLAAPSGSWVHPSGEQISYRDIYFDESRAGAA